MGGERAERLRRTWIERLSSESDLFIQGFMREERGEWREAAHCYFEDAVRCEELGDRRMAAVSYAAAARCFELSGDVRSAANCYLKASEIFGEEAAREEGGRAEALRLRASEYRAMVDRLAPLSRRVELRERS